MMKEVAQKARELINTIETLEKDITRMEPRYLDIKPRIDNCGCSMEIMSLTGADLLPLLNSKLKSAESKLAKLK